MSIRAFDLVVQTIGSHAIASPCLCARVSNLDESEAKMKLGRGFRCVIHISPYRFVSAVQTSYFLIRG